MRNATFLSKIYVFIFSTAIHHRLNPIRSHFEEILYNLPVMETANQSLPNIRGLPDEGLGQGHRSIHGGNNQPTLTSQEAIVL